MVKKESSKKEKSNKILRVFPLRNIVLFIFVLVAVFGFYRMETVFNSLAILDKNEGSLIKELGQMKDVSVKVGQDLNEVRKYLNLTTGNYFLSDVLEEPVDASENKNHMEVALFQYIDFIGKNQEMEKTMATSKTFLNILTGDPDIAQALDKAGGLKLMPAVETEADITVSVTHSQYGEIFSYKISKEDGLLYFISPNGEDKITADTFEGFKQNELKFIQKDTPTLVENAKNLQNKKAEVDGALRSAQVTKVMTAREIKAAEFPIITATEVSYQILNIADEPVAQIILNKKSLKVTFRDLNSPDTKEEATKLLDSVVSFLSKLDIRTKLERRAEDSKASLEKTLNDSGFKSLLAGVGLKFGEPREDKDRIYYDLFNSEGKHLSSIVIEKATGIVNIVDPDGTNSENLLYFDPEFKKKTLEIPTDIPNYGDELSNGNGKLHILLIGKQGGNTDTIILVQLDENTKKARMVSIPRDLFYNGRKINAYYTIYGMDEFIKALQNITGYKIDKYVLVDMYAFIDIVDLIGGIDVHLDKALVDPNYRVVDNGVEGTLHYEPGDYHLGGVEATRLARSRKTTSDFSRAERQQMILKAIQEKAKSLGLSDISTIYEIAKVVLKKVETNVNFENAIAYYFKYKDYEIESNAVMSSGNVLYSPPYQPIEECRKIISDDAAAGQAKPTCETDTNHAYTLIPKNEDWDVIKWYFRQQFE